MLAELMEKINSSADMAESQKGTTSSVNSKGKDSLLGTIVLPLCAISDEFCV